MSRKSAIICLLAGLMTIATSSHAFDGKRKGFIFGFGFGPSVTSYTQTLPIEGKSVTSDREYNVSLATDFRIGMGHSEKLLLYYVERTTWFSKPVISGGTSILANSVGGIGASYYLSETFPSLYIHGLVGFSTWAPLKSLGDTWAGAGFGAGVGYEFSSHWSFEGSINYGNPSKEEEGLEATTNAFSLCVTIFSHAY